MKCMESFFETKRTEREADHSPVNIAEVKRTWELKGSDDGGVLDYVRD
jgi:hypothetical protein